MPKKVPIELYELIIDLVNDEKTLRATSLVCKAWVTRSRLNLFRVVELCTPNHLDRLVDLLAFAPHVAPCIKEIVISENPLLAFFRPSLATVARFPQSLSAHPHVQPRRLVVHRQWWLSTRYDPDYLSGLSQFSSITSLDLFDVVFTTVADFSIILRALKHIKSLSASQIDCQRTLQPGILAAIGTELSHLTSLRVSVRSRTYAVDWLIQYNSFPSLKAAEISYELSDPRDGTHQGLGAFWAASGSTLEYLSLSILKRSMGTSVLYDVMQTQLDMSHCTALRTLRLDWRDERKLASDWIWLKWFFSYLPYPGHALRTIIFEFRHTSHALVTLHEFAEDLDRVLVETPALASLEAVVFKFDLFRPGEDVDEDVLLHKFSALRQRGLLRVA